VNAVEEAHENLEELLMATDEQHLKRLPMDQKLGLHDLLVDVANGDEGVFDSDARHRAAMAVCRLVRDMLRELELRASKRKH
jgi:hypothetical protein